MNIKRRIIIWSITAALLLVFGCLFGGCQKKEAQIKQPLELTVTQLELTVGDSEEVGVKTPQKGTEYSFSSTSDAVSVSDTGVVKAEKVGAACIIVSSKTGSGVCVVVVKDTKPVA